MNDYSTKRIYESVKSTDGIRILVDRIWPRGISKEKAQLTVWMKEIAPSAELRKWFQHVPERFAEFKQRYQAELQRDEANTYLEQLRLYAKDHPVTLVYAASDVHHNQAVVLKEFLDQHK